MYWESNEEELKIPPLGTEGSLPGQGRNRVLEHIYKSNGYGLLRTVLSIIVVGITGAAITIGKEVFSGVMLGAVAFSLASVSVSQSTGSTNRSVPLLFHSYIKSSISNFQIPGLSTYSPKHRSHIPQIEDRPKTSPLNSRPNMFLFNPVASRIYKYLHHRHHSGSPKRRKRWYHTGPQETHLGATSPHSVARTWHCSWQCGRRCIVSCCKLYSCDWLCWVWWKLLACVLLCSCIACIIYGRGALRWRKRRMRLTRPRGGVVMGGAGNLERSRSWLHWLREL